ncbi:RND family efflux transporter, MFP subunit [Shimia gijangensis]|uniref:RND family efflux transporter, MFP subunit n=1 Tax=Shimia gijangensis TaxID=1470563 RepID=A0A1M6BCF9_9RHOB|nr:efflux RND transporter periplasmic adaptor subunit [Shimia gijangensis]SHI46133.1 RND family efflux transporter, MFP subunit [Shimia gijangensis]
MNFRPLLFIPPIAAGVAVFMWLTTAGPESEMEAPPETVTVVRTLSLAPTMATPSASGYGRVVAEDSWSAISQVQGRAVLVDPELDEGAIIEAGTEIIRIDARDYEISLARAIASRDSAQAALEELTASEENTRSTIRLEKRIEELRKSELGRQETLLARGNASQAKVDEAVRVLLAQEKVVLSLENSLRLLPAQRASLQATFDTRLVDIEEAERALANTSIFAPLTGRVTATTVSDGQFVRVGDTLATIEGTNASEVVAEFQTRVLGNLFTTLENDLTREKLVGLGAADASVLLKRFNLQAKVRMSSGDQEFFWPAEVIRFDGSADPTTGTVGIVVRIADPSLPDPERPGPPLSNGSFVEVQMSMPKPISALRVQRSAIHTDDAGSYVYTVDGQSRLARNPIQTGSVQDDMVVVLSGLSEGDEIVLSDPRPAIVGMLLKPVDDREVSTE